MRKKMLMYVTKDSMLANFRLMFSDTIHQLKSVYHEVEMSGTVDSSESDKICSTKIKIGAKINIAGIIKASIDIIKNKTEKESAASSGDYGNAASSGDKGSAKASHKNSCAVAWGPESKAKGVIGSHLVLAEWESNGGYYWEEKTWDFKGAVMAVVDGEKIKENVWYGLKNGKVIEIKED